MTAKLALPALVPSEFDRLGAVNFNDRDDFMRAATVLLAHHDGYLAGIDAVIALLREPDEAMQQAAARAIYAGRIPPDVNVCEARGRTVSRTLADELERRKP